MVVFGRRDQFPFSFFFSFAFKDGLEAVSRICRKVDFWRQTSSESWKIRFFLLPTQTDLWCHSGTVFEDSEATSSISRKECHSWLVMSVNHSAGRVQELCVFGDERLGGSSERLWSWFQTGMWQLKCPSHRTRYGNALAMTRWPVRSTKRGVSCCWLTFVNPFFL